MITMFALLAALSQQPDAATPEAAVQEDGWGPARVLVTRGGEVQQAYDIVFSRQTDVPSAAFYCGEGYLRVRLATEPIAMRETVREMFPRRRVQTVRLSIGGEDKGTSRWGYLPSEKLIVSTGRKEAAQVFNAVVRGVPVSFEMRGQTVATSLPPIDDEFERWIDRCKDNGSL